MEHVSIQLGHIDLREIDNKEYVESFVQSRAARLNVDLETYEIHVDKATGCVKAATKMHSAKKAKIIYDG